MKVEQILQDVFQIGDEVCRREIASKSSIKYFRHPEIIIKEGQVQSNIYFLISGAARGYTSFENGDEFTDCITSKAGLPLVSTNLFEKTASLNFQVLLDGNYLIVPHNLILELINENPEIMSLVCQRLADALVYHNTHKKILYRSTAREKLLWFEKMHPDLIGKLKQIHVASYLGIAPETLSKIKKIRDSV
ncbi:MAG: Crp/Fnr family transcriptional regulator [Ruminococcaceae bacterium]|nr:Crp/Fnr family transcriptional regulator [Oscillospiraceae bacterium]